jgi:hypothetical protein
MFLHPATAIDLLPGHGALFDPALYNVLGNHTPAPAHFSLQISPRPEEKNERENVGVRGEKGTDRGVNRQKEIRKIKERAREEVNGEKGEKTWTK